jgi:FAD/FMN-containing dehydrogenase
MADLRMITTTGSHTVIEGSTLETFKTSLRGELLRPGNADYDEARKVWNGMIDKRPGLIARCAGVADVIRAVDFARTHQLLVSVRGGGHNIPGNAVCNGGLMIDLARMRGVRVDPVKHTARAEGGVTWGEFDRETQAFGLATTGGSVSDTGIAGLTLGGGLGWLAGKCGLTCDNLLSADAVTADGKLLVANANEHADLFWGLRGGGGNFGIVTSFEYQLHSVGPVLAGMLLHPFAKAKEALAFYRDFAKAIPDEVNTISSGGAYITQMGVEAEEGADRIKDVYGPNYERLVAVKHKYDPTNLFRHNQNVKPAV